MNIKNTVSLTISEAVEFFAKLADSLEQTSEFAFDLKGQEVSIEAADELSVQLSIKPDEFSIIFNWDIVDTDWHTPDASSTPEKKLGIPVPTRTIEAPQLEAPKQKASIVVSGRALPNRMTLNTTTLPLDAGYWSSVFSSDDESQWSEIQINRDLENTKWATQDQLTTLSDLTPASAKPRKVKTRRRGSDEDLFSELDELDDQKRAKPKPKTSRKSTQQEIAPPTSAAYNIPAPVIASTTKVNEMVDNWSEPKPENNVSEDDLVKPSDYLKKDAKKRAQGKIVTKSIPQPPSSTKSPSGSSKGKPIPIPNQEVNQWSEPSRDEENSAEELVKPSEIRKEIKKVSKMKSKIKRPPPKAPDKETEDEKG